MGEEGTGRKKWTELTGLGRDPWRRLWGRRAITIPLYFILCVLLLAVTPVLLPLALVLDALRSSKWAFARMIAFLLLYFGCEVLGILAGFLLWLLAGPYVSRDVEGYLRRNFVLQCWWARTLAGGAFKIFSIQLEVEGLREFGDRPILLFVRHASTADAVLPAMLIGVPQKIMLRYIMKRELLVDPCLDIVGNRLPNYFVRRGSGDGAKEIEAISQLMCDLSPGQGVLMYPEGARFTAAKRERILKRLEGSGDRDTLRRATDMPHVLPPRLGGSLALLERNEGADAVFCVHTGLESTTSISQLWRGGLVGSRVQVKFWVVPFEEIPKERTALSDWLWAEWAKVNAFLEDTKGKEVC